MLSDTGALKERVEFAIGRLVESNEERKTANQTLIKLLSDLEVKYDSRHEEVSYCLSRIEELESRNRQLTELLEAVVALMERMPDQTTDPIYRATEIARMMVEEWDDAPHASHVSVTGSAPEPDDAPAAPEPDFAEREAAEAAPLQPASNVVHLNFDDVGEEELEVERLLESELDVAALPIALVTAISAFRRLTGQPELELPAAAELDDEIADARLEAPAALATLLPEETVSVADAIPDDDDEDLAADIDIPQRDEAPDFEMAEPRDLDIRAMLSRIERAAARANARADHDLDEDVPPRPRHAAVG